MYGLNGDEVTGVWRRLHNEELSELRLSVYFSDDQSMKTEMGVACGRCGGQKKCFQGFSGETWRKETIWKT